MLKYTSKYANSRIKNNNNNCSCIQSVDYFLSLSSVITVDFVKDFFIYLVFLVFSGLNSFILQATINNYMVDIPALIRTRTL